MKQIYRYKISIVVAFALSCVFAAFSPASEFRYLVPGNIVMTLEPAAPAVQPSSMTLVATIRAKIGAPRNLEIFFESTPDFTVTPDRASVSELASSPLKTEVTVTKVGMPADGESWVRMRVVYEPDYESLLRTIENPFRYPDPAERKRLADRIMKNSEKRARQTDAVRYFPIMETGEN